MPMSEDMIPELAAESSHAVHVPAVSPHASIATMPLPTPRRTRSQSISGFPPPPMRRTSTDMTGLSRPVSFSAKFQRVHPATTGVTVLEHMERLDAVEAGLKRLGVEEGEDSDDVEGQEEVDVGESSSSVSQSLQNTPQVHRVPSSAPPTQTLFGTPPLSHESPRDGGAGLLSPSARSDRLPVVPEAEDALSMSFAEEDLISMSKSTSHIEAPHSALHTRFQSYHAAHPEEERPNLDWMQAEHAESPRTKTVIVEVRVLSSDEVVETGADDHNAAAGDGRREATVLVLVRTLDPIVTGFHCCRAVFAFSEDCLAWSTCTFRINMIHDRNTIYA